MSENNSSLKRSSLDFGILCKTSFKGFFARFWPFFFYGFLIQAILVGLRLFSDLYLPYFFDKTELSESTFAFLIIAIILVLIVGSFFVGVFSQLIYNIITKSYLHSSKVSLGSYFNYAWSNLMKASGIVLRVLWYVCKWLIVSIFIVVLLGGILQIYLMAGVGEVSFVKAQFIEVTDNYDDSAPLGIGGNSSPMNEVLQKSTMILPFILTILSAVVLFIGGITVITRSVRAMFVIPAFVEDAFVGKQALEVSKNLVDGRWWSVCGYMLLFSVILIPLFIVILAVWFLPLVIPSMMPNNIWLYGAMASLATVVFSIFISALFSIFIYKFYLELKKIAKP